MDKIIKRLASYFKTNWEVEDYPIESYLNENAGEDNVKYGALIKDWSGMVGHGETKEKALQNLEEHFKMFKEKNKLPRPGTKKPLEFALTNQIDKYEAIAVTFFDIVLRLNYYECFVSDQSSLVDFESLEGDSNPDDFRRKIIARVLENYAVDISDTYDKYLIDVFEKISQHKN